MGLCHERQGHLDEALQDFQRSLDLLPQAVFRDMARLGLVRVFELTGQTSEAWNQLRLHLRENPGSEAGLKTGLRIAREEGNLEQERDYLLRLINHSAGGETEIAEWRRRLTEIENAG
jgi:Tfp pilus assembly protein PilF